MNNITTIFSNIISILSVGISLFAAFLCLVNGQQVNKAGNRWLGIFMLCIFLDIAYNMLDIAGIKIEDAIISSVLGSGFYICPGILFHYLLLHNS